MIDADIARHRAKPNPTTYANWFVQASLILGAPGTDIVLIQLLPEHKYEDWAARGLLQLVSVPNHDKPWLGRTLNFEAIWGARTGIRPSGFDAVRARQYAQAITRRIIALRQESSSAVEPHSYAGRIKTLAVLLAALDGRKSATFIIDALTPAGRWDAYARMNGIRALVVSGAILSLDSMLTVLDPAIEHTLSQGLYNDQNLSLLVDCLELLPFSDDPERAIARIEQVMGRFQFRPYQIRGLVTALGHTRSEAAVPFLLKLARGQGGVQNMEDEWIEALGRLNVPTARNVLLSFIDPQVQPVGVNINFDYRNSDNSCGFCHRLGAARARA